MTTATFNTETMRSMTIGQLISAGFEITAKRRDGDECETFGFGQPLAAPILFDPSAAVPIPAPAVPAIASENIGHLRWLGYAVECTGTRWHWSLLADEGARGLLDASDHFYKTEQEAWLNAWEHHLRLLGHFENKVAYKDARRVPRSRFTQFLKEKERAHNAAATTVYIESAHMTCWVVGEVTVAYSLGRLGDWLAWAVRSS